MSTTKTACRTTIYKCSHYLPRKLLIQIYNSFINSKISYCIESRGNAPNTHTPLFIYCKLIRIIRGKHYLNPSTFTTFRDLLYSLFIIFTNLRYCCYHTRSTILNPFIPLTTFLAHLFTYRTSNLCIV